MKKTKQKTNYIHLSSFTIIYKQKKTKNKKKSTTKNKKK